MLLTDSPQPVDTGSTARIVTDEHARVGRWIQSHGGTVWREGATCIGLERHGELVAGVMYDYYNQASIHANIAITGMLTPEFLHFIFFYPFEQLGVNLVIVSIAEGNTKSIRLVEHLGFTRYMAIPDADPSGATLIYLMYKPHCRWLAKETHGKV